MKKQGLDDYLIVHAKSDFKKLLDNARGIRLKDIQRILTGNLAQTVPFPVNIFSQKIKDLLIELHERHDAPLRGVLAHLLFFLNLYINLLAC